MDRASAPDRLRTWMASAVVVVAIAAAHGRAVTADFVAFDDDQYVFQNEHVQRGLAPASFAWAFELDHPRSYFHPLTWLSLMLDRTLLGPGAWGFHLVNVVLHAALALVLLPILLLLLDVWPLRRIGVPPGPRSEPGLARLVVEKWPVALAAAAAVV